MITLDHAITLLQYGQLEGMVPAVSDIPDEALYTTMTPVEMRTKAAKAFLHFAQDRTTPFPTFVLSLIHTALADPSAEIRLLLTSTLFYAGDQTSLQPLHDLIAAETKRLATELSPRSLSCGIIAYARAAAVRCDSPDHDMLMHTERPIITLLTGDLEIASHITVLAEELQAVVHYLSCPSELLWIPSAIHVIDRTCLSDLTTWDFYIEQLQDDAKVGFADSTPLILLDDQPTLWQGRWPVKAPTRLMVISDPVVVAAAVRHFLTRHRPRPINNKVRK